MALRRTPIRRVSKKRAKDMVEYSRLRKEFLEQHPYCQAWNKIRTHLNLVATLPPPSTEVHHIKGRRSFYLDVRYFLAVCRDSHDWIHRHPMDARKLGLLV